MEPNGAALPTRSAGALLFMADSDSDSRMTDRCPFGHCHCPHGGGRIVALAVGDSQVFRFQSLANNLAAGLGARVGLSVRMSHPIFTGLGSSRPHVATVARLHGFNADVKRGGQSSAIAKPTIKTRCKSISACSSVG